MLFAVDGNIVAGIIGAGAAVGIAVFSGAWKLSKSMGSIEQLVRDIDKSQVDMSKQLSKHNERITALEVKVK